LLLLLSLLLFSLALVGAPLSLRVLLDGSALEVFTSTGETLTTRIYRGHPPTPTAAVATAAANVCVPTTPNYDAACVDKQLNQEGEDETGISLFAAGAAAAVSRVDVWEMGCCMESLNDAAWLDREIYVHPQHQADDADQDRVLRQAARSTGSSSSTAVINSSSDTLLVSAAAEFIAEIGVSAAAAAAAGAGAVVAAKAVAEGYVTDAAADLQGVARAQGTLACSTC
jgi:hypothetical protein